MKISILDSTQVPFRGFRGRVQVKYSRFTPTPNGELFGSLLTPTLKGVDWQHGKVDMVF